jgi:Ca2+-dependent lipid-binding protein
VYPGLEPDLIHLDLDLTFEPQMADDNQTNGTRIQLVAKMVKLDLPVSVNDIHFKGKLRLQLKLISRHPYVKIVEFCFLQPPELEFVLKPLIPVNVMDVPLFQDFLYNIVQSALSGFVSPSTFTMDIEQMMNPDQTANGIIFNSREVWNGLLSPFLSLPWSGFGDH